MNVGLSNEQRNGVVQILNTVLSDEYVLYTKMRNYHWNVAGPQFNDLHKFFEARYTELTDIVDDVAERARALGPIPGNSGGIRSPHAARRTPGNVSECPRDGHQPAE